MGGAAIGSRFYFGDERRFGLRVELSALGEETFDETVVSSRGEPLATLSRK